MSRRRYLARRLVAGACVGVLLIGLVRVIGGLVAPDESIAGGTADVVSGDGSGGDDTDARTGGAAGGDTDARTDGAAGGDPDAGTEDASGDDGDAGTDGSSAQRQPSGVPTPSEPARVLIVGDSDAGTFGPYLQQLLGNTNITETRLDYKVSSGLARPDFFDWHAELAGIVPEFDPDIVVITFGGNDGQFLADDNGGVVVGQPAPDRDNSAWSAEYRERVGRVLDYLAADGRTVVWVGIPNHVDPDVRFRMQVQDEAVRAEMAERPDVRFVDAWTRFAGRNGGFAEFLIDPRDGQGKAVRAGDGFHLNQVGAEILAIDISQVIFDDLRDRGAAI